LRIRDIDKEFDKATESEDIRARKSLTAIHKLKRKGQKEMNVNGSVHCCCTSAMLEKLHWYQGVSKSAKQQ